MYKYIRVGKVAVLYAPGYGAGWSTWNSDSLIFDSILVQAVLDGRLGDVEKRAEELCPGGYFGGINDLEVKWVPEGCKFRITEYDGSENIVLMSEESYYTA